MPLEKQKLALIGANGMLASAIKKLTPANYHIESYDLPDFDITNRAQVLALQDAAPDIIINCAAYTNVDGCESHSELAMRVNGEGPGLLAEVAKNIDAVLVHISTDFVFAGDKNSPYREEDPPGALSAYGQSKLLGEQSIISSGLEKYFIVRTSWLYGPNGNNFVETIIRLATEREELGIVADQHGTPTYTGDLAVAIFKLLALVSVPCSSALKTQSPYGIYHFSNEGECTWYDFACEIVHLLRCRSVELRVKTIKPLRTNEYPVPAKRPAYSVMSKKKYKAATGLQISGWRESLRRYFEGRF